MKSLIPWKNRQENAAPSLWADDWFNRAWSNPFSLLAAPFSGIDFPKQPSVDVSEDKKSVTVRAELPGMNEKEIDLTWHEGILRIRGEKKHEREEKKRGRVYNECSYGYVARDIPIGDRVDWSAAKAIYKHGVLTVKLPKTEKSRETIQITVN
ncbi:MAG: Hsp20/alpha crystallin family protein [Chitinispirillaceae bacterium]|nr:Hsp20/alpha crystallin family protein [Chitinispirillaceae bacterium]